MRSIAIVAILAGFLVPAAQAAEIRVISPGVISNSGLRENAAAFTKATGVTVTIVVDGMGTIVHDIKTATPPADVVMLPMNLMSSLALDKGLEPGSFTPLGRVEIGLFVKPDAPHPDISTVEKLAAALKGASAVLYTNPASGSMQAGFIDQMLKQPEFTGVHGVKIKGDAEPALRRGDGDANAMGIGLIHGAHPLGQRTANPYLVGQLPAELQAHMDMATAVSARSTDAKDADAFVRFITGPDMLPVWMAGGTTRY